jgi:hypothetical protein
MHRPDLRNPKPSSHSYSATYRAPRPPHRGKATATARSPVRISSSRAPRRPRPLADAGIGHSGQVDAKKRQIARCPSPPADQRQGSMTSGRAVLELHLPLRRSQLTKELTLHRHSKSPSFCQGQASFGVAEDLGEIPLTITSGWLQGCAVPRAPRLGQSFSNILDNATAKSMIGLWQLWGDAPRIGRLRSDDLQKAEMGHPCLQ